jgi:hypothetical protein
LLNVSTEADDMHPVLRRQAVGILDVFRNTIVSLLSKGIEHGQIKPGIEKEHYASLIIATLEGAIMMSKLRGNNDDIKITIRHLESLIDQIKI